MTERTQGGRITPYTELDDNSRDEYFKHVNGRKWFMSTWLSRDIRRLHLFVTLRETGDIYEYDDVTVKTRTTFESSEDGYDKR